MSRIAICPAIVVFLTVAVGPPVLAGNVYWTDKEDFTIRRGDMDGIEPMEVLVSGLGQPRGLGLDLAGGKMYWADATTLKIQRANLDGSDVEDLVTTGFAFPADLELDLGAGKIYWTDTGLGVIRRANLNGSQVEDVRTGMQQPYYFELDTDAEKIYFAKLETGNSIVHRMNLDGTGAIEDLVTGLVNVRDVGLDPVGGILYWNDRDSHKVQRRPLDGSGPVEDLFTFIPGRGKPHGLALDLDGGMAYWTDTRTNWIMRGSLDGTGSPEVLYSGLTSPWDIELDPVPEPSTWGLLLAGLVGAAAFARRKSRCR